MNLDQLQSLGIDSVDEVRARILRAYDVPSRGERLEYVFRRGPIETLRKLCSVCGLDWTPFETTVDLFVAGGAIASVIRVPDSASAALCGNDVDVFFRTDNFTKPKLAKFFRELYERTLGLAKENDGSIDDRKMKASVYWRDDVKLPPTHALHSSYFKAVETEGSFTYGYLKLCPNSLHIKIMDGTLPDTIEYNFVINPDFICSDDMPLSKYMTRFDFTICAAAYDPGHDGLEAFQFHHAAPRAIINGLIDSFCKPEQVQAYRLMKYLEKGYVLDSSDPDWYDTMMEVHSAVFDDCRDMKNMEEDLRYANNEEVYREIREKYTHIPSLYYDKEFDV